MVPGAFTNYGPIFNPAYKVQVEDDITASVVLPRESLSGPGPEYANPSVKLVVNCENVAFFSARMMRFTGKQTSKRKRILQAPGHS